jgi:hypothetical protein
MIKKQRRPMRRCFFVDTVSVHFIHDNARDFYDDVIRGGNAEIIQAFAAIIAEFLRIQIAIPAFMAMIAYFVFV